MNVCVINSLSSFLSFFLVDVVEGQESQHPFAAPKYLPLDSLRAPESQNDDGEK